MKQDAKYLKNVRAQYETLPYPPRDPKEEKTRLINPDSERLSNLNHFLYRGRRDFRDFRVLVAGAGTGDGTIYLADQLRGHRGARVVSLDISQASTDVCRQRAKVRGLRNITFLHASLLELGELGLEPFDYVNCTGVLHHLADPDAGMVALTSVLKPDGGLGLMLYARYGRTGVYQMQELMRRVNKGVTDTHEKVENTKAMLACLPPTNWFKRGEDLVSDHARMGDAGIYDLLLHEQDRAYTVLETYDFVERAGLHLIDYCRGIDRILLSPATYVRDAELRATIARLPLRKQRAVAELLSGSHTKQHVYAAPAPDTVASLEDPDNVPFLVGFVVQGAHAAMAEQMRRRPNAPFEIKSRGPSYAFVPGRHTARIFHHMDGMRSLGEIFEAVRREVGDPSLSDEALRADFEPAYAKMAFAGNMLLRHKSLPPFPEPRSTQAPGGGGR
jgi:SAM-dependent methyltransferase